MIRKRWISLMLSFALLLSLWVPGTPAIMEGEGGEEGDIGLKYDKTVNYSEEDGYSITLEAYATGEKVISEEMINIPTDIVFVLDQSTSMEEDMNQYEFVLHSDQRNGTLFNYRHNGGYENLWYPLSDGGYASVSVVREALWYVGDEIPSNWVNYRLTLATDSYYEISNDLWEKIDNDFYKVKLEQFGGIWDRTYRYTFADGKVLISEGNRTIPDFASIGKGPLYTNIRPGEYIYKYTYTDPRGVERVIGISDGSQTDFSPALYRKQKSGAIPKLEALKQAMNSFADIVRTKAIGDPANPEDDVDHRIAMVGFGMGPETGYVQAPFLNTEAFDGATQIQYDPSLTGGISDQTATAVMKRMKTQEGYNDVIASIGVLEADGATRTDLGLEMANRIFENNPIPASEKRNRVVVVLTDGVPGITGYNQDVAEWAIGEANKSKNVHGATVYTVGIFDGADPTEDGEENGYYPDNANWFMQNLSSNNGVPQLPSYYLSADNAAGLTSIFQQIASQIEEGGSSSQLTEEAVIRDIMSPQFRVPPDLEASEIEIKTYRYTGEDSWEENVGQTLGATASIDGEQVSITGFNYSENWCGTVTTDEGTTNRGNKLVITFPIEPKPQFIGGNNVPTNSYAGIFENANATQPLVEFPKPKANVPIHDIVMDAVDFHVYLFEDIRCDEIAGSMQVTVGGQLGTNPITLDLSPDAVNFGLQAWQTEYVDISLEIRDTENQLCDGFDKITEDEPFTVKLSITPKNPPEVSSVGPGADEHHMTESGSILVYKPELTFRDSWMWYGQDAPENYNWNLMEKRWLHGTTNALQSPMHGSEPTLHLVHTPEEGKIVDGKIATKDDIGVVVDVRQTYQNVEESILQYTTFQHKYCDPIDCGFDPNGPFAFLLHVQECELTVVKEGGNPGDPYVFDILKLDEADQTYKPYTQLTIVPGAEGSGQVTIKELPIGTYKLAEDEKWSWRYSGENGEALALTPEAPKGTVTCTNTPENDDWLNDYSEVKTNTAAPLGSN